MARTNKCKALSSCLSCILYSLVLFLVICIFVFSGSPITEVNLFDNNVLPNMTQATDNPPTNISIHFDLVVSNMNIGASLHYLDPLKITFSYYTDVSNMVTLAEYKLDSFYQGIMKTRHVKDVVETSSFRPQCLKGRMLYFRVDLVGTYRARKGRRKTFKLVRGCLIGVDYRSGASKKILKGFVELVEPEVAYQLKNFACESGSNYYSFSYLRSSQVSQSLY